MLTSIEIIYPEWELSLFACKGGVVLESVVLDGSSSCLGWDRITFSEYLRSQEFYTQNVILNTLKMAGHCVKNLSLYCTKSRFRLAMSKTRQIGQILSYQGLL